MTSGLSSIDIELALAVIAMTVLTLLAYRLGHLWKLKSQRLENLVLAVSVGLAFLLAWSYFGRLVWAEAITSSSALYWSNVTPIALGFTSGLVGHTRGLRRAVRPFVTACLMILAVGYVATPIARPVLFPLTLDPSPKWKNGICLQSHSASCAPAAAATLLKLNGVESREDVLADACLSSTLGTAPLGLYRGLKTVANEHGLQTCVAAKDPTDWLQAGQLPNVALVSFEAFPGQPIGNRFLGSRYSGHVITVLGKTDGGRWLIGDPAVGRISWSDDELRRRITGEAIYLKR
ncbi:cysteine peptidase family C39 domain-containing protein [Aporhodopirellula aestuarii]|uniref:Peptidase C39 n=1 Tax=Aporhodopirellula aestuarii TaxID=2950107 RepID=A0ABT0U3C9_9BACT|nr:peptidase C39 [Aporhodopirellula aestuarii]MCM2371387.1 peptidase C39 [Aporhodopirellula aestuarii]